MTLCKKCGEARGLYRVRTIGGQQKCRGCHRRLWKCGWYVKPREAALPDTNVGNMEGGEE